MPRIRLVLEDEDGNAIPAAGEQIYRLEGDLDTLDQIEQAVETFKKRALPDIEHSLLDQAQERFVAQGEKSERRRPPAAP